MLLTYGRTRGSFAGISLTGAALVRNDSVNRRLYGKEVSATNVVRDGAVLVPPVASELIGALDETSPLSKSQLI